MQTAPSHSSLPPRGVSKALGGVLLLSASLFLAPRIAPRACGSQAGAEAADFRAEVLLNAAEGQPEIQLSELRGKAVLLDFWASWCGPCRAEMPVLARIHERHKDDGLVVVGINTSEGEGRTAINARQLRIPFPVVYDDDNRIADSYGVHGLPTLVVVSRTGKIIAIRAGTASESALEELVRKALAS